MAKSWVKQAAYAASGIALLGLTGCGGGSPDDGYNAQPSSAYEQDGYGSGELMGGQQPLPPARDDSGLAGGPADGYRGMAAIPNPEDLPLAERRAIYGNKYDHLKYTGARKATYAKGKKAHPPGAPLKSWRDASGKLIVAMRPIPNPEDMSPAERRRVYGKRYAPRAYAAPGGGRRERVWTSPKPVKAAAPVRRAPAMPTVAAKPVPVAPKPKAIAAAPAPRPIVKPAPAPVKVAPPKAVAKAAPPPQPKLTPPVVAPVAKAPAPKPVVGDPKMAQLSAAVGPAALKGATLTVPEALARGEEAKVTLALPVDLMDVVKAEAAKLGLTKAARKAEVSATLTGDGYAITPNAAQTQTLKTGEAATFDWQVAPGDGEKSPLRATVDGALVGQKGAPKTFSIATLEQVMAETVDTAKSQARKLGFNLDRFAIPGLKPITVGDTVITPGAITAGILALLVLLIAGAMARSGSARRDRAERRRKFRTMNDYSRAEAEPEPEHRSSVNPFVAGAVGAAAGAAAMHFADDHKAEEVAPEAHGHEAHAPAHEEPTYVAHDAHAPEAHGEAAHAHEEPVHAEAAHEEPAHEAAAHDEHPPAEHAPEAHAPDAHGEAAHAQEPHHGPPGPYANPPAAHAHDHHREPEHA